MIDSDKADQVKQAHFSTVGTGMCRRLATMICFLFILGSATTSYSQNLIRVGVAYQVNTHMENQNPDLPQVNPVEDDIFNYATINANFDIPIIDWAAISVGAGYNYSLNKEYLNFPYFQAAIRMYSWDVHEGFYAGGYGATGLNFDLAYYAFGLNTGFVLGNIDFEARFGYSHTTSSVGSSFKPRFGGIQGQIGANVAIPQGRRYYGRP